MTIENDIRVSNENEIDKSEPNATDQDWPNLGFYEKDNFTYNLILTFFSEFIFS